MSIKCDVLVVGGGPAGSSAARAAAKKGNNVVLIEKLEKPGKVACGEAVGRYLLPYIDFPIPREHLIWKTNGMSFDIEGLHIKRYGKLWDAYSIDRQKFDNWLFEKAKDAGTITKTNTEMIDLFQDNKSVYQVIAKKDNKKIIFEPKVIIAADGTESQVLKSLGLFKPKKDDIAEIYSYEYENVNITNPDLEQIYLGEFINGGYGYVFPKSKNKINIGVGSVFNQNLENSFQEFTELPQIKKQIQNGKMVKEKIGKVSVSSYLEKEHYKNVLFTGDAAFQNFKPYAEGILPGIVCGNVCGKVASQIIKSKVSIDIYEKKIEQKIGYLFKESDKITETIYDLFLMKEDKKFLLLAGFASNYLKIKDIYKLKKLEYNDILKIIKEKMQYEFYKKTIEDIQIFLLKFKRLMS